MREIPADFAVNFFIMVGVMGSIITWITAKILPLSKKLDRIMLLLEGDKWHEGLMQRIERVENKLDGQRNEEDEE